jgi:hypothetical protein
MKIENKRLKNHKFFAKQFFLQKNRKGIEFSFTWLFAVIIGAIILVLAIYAATKLIGTGGTETSTISAKEIGILLNPLETGFGDGKTTSFSISTDTMIYNRCDNLSNFGSQKIQVRQKTFGKWNEPSAEVSFQNKYLFSNSIETGNKFYVFSKPFYLPFKVSDVIYFTSDDEKYCFIGAPKNIEDELNQLKQGNLATGNNCSALENYIKVCFGSNSDCDIKVSYNMKYVEKNKSRMYFETDALMYGAIFSDNKTYECQVKRLVMRAEELSSIYSKKAVLLSQRECNMNLDLNGFKIITDLYEDSSDLQTITGKANEIGEDNEVATCPLW